MLSNLNKYITAVCISSCRILQSSRHHELRFTTVFLPGCFFKTHPEFSSLTVPILQKKGRVASGGSEQWCARVKHFFPIFISHTIPLA